MKIVIAPNAFKGSLTATQAAECMGRGLRRALPDCELIMVPVADGGDGTVFTVVAATGGRQVDCQAHDPLGRPILSTLGMTGDGQTAVIEMALASGLALLKKEEQNPLLTGTAGTGELISAALDLGARKILIGIGGSATNDGGIGMAHALGARFSDARGNQLDGIGGALEQIAHIDLSGLDVRLSQVDIEVACDVDNPLFGAHGAAHVYAPQKGATPEITEQLDNGLRRLAEVIHSDLNLDISTLPGGGAAGGLGAGLVAFLGAKLRPGAELVLRVCSLTERMKDCDLVITGEGRLDGQTVSGKAPAAVAQAARSRGVPVIAISGCLGDNVEKVLDAGINAYFSALEESMAEADLLLRGAGMLERCAEQVGRLLALNVLSTKAKKISAEHPAQGTEDKGERL